MRKNCKRSKGEKKKSEWQIKKERQEERKKKKLNYPIVREVIFGTSYYSKLFMVQNYYALKIREDRKIS